MWTKRRLKNGLGTAIVFMSLFILYLNYQFQAISPLYLCFVILGATLMLFIIWLFVSGRLIIPSKKIKIAISIETNDSDTQRILMRSVRKIKRELQVLGVYKEFRFFEIGHDIFKTHKQAGKFACKKKIELIFHGTICKDKLEDRVVFSMKDTFFTYVYIKPKENTPLLKIFKNDILLLTKHEEWLIHESNTLIDIDKVAISLAEHVLTILSITLSTNIHHTDKAITLMKAVIPYIEKHIP